MNNRGLGVRPQEGKYFHRAQADFEAKKADNRTDTRDSSHGSKPAGSCSWQLTSTQCRVWE